jgi:c(7)-type cytochrome triheme protein
MARGGALYRHLFAVFLLVPVAVLLTGCTSIMEEVLYEKTEGDKASQSQSASTYYEAFYRQATVAHNQGGGKSAGAPPALDALPKDSYGQVNWTLAVMEGYLNPKGSLVPDAEDEKPLDLNVFIEAKVALMANVIFPHSIHTYWLSCANCHPGIFIPEAGANDITMDGIFAGKWCGRCHGKVAFPPGYNINPKANCIRCHVIPKQMSRERESW